MRLKYSNPIALALLVLLAAPLPLAGANSQVIGRTQDANPVINAEPDYKVSKLSHKTDTMEVYYPQLDLPNMLTAVLVNYQLIQAPGNYMANIAPSAKLNMDYMVTRQDENIISVVFRGEQIQENSTEPLLTSVNYNLKTRIPITAKRLIRDTDEARQGINRLLQQAGKAQPGMAEPPAFSDKMGIYLTGKFAVFYYLPSDSAAKFAELPLAIDHIRQYLSDEYRTLTVTKELTKDPRQVITDIDKSLASYKSVSGKHSDGDISADFTAYFTDTQLVYIEEKQNKGEYNTGIAKYYFDGAKLIAYTKNSESLIVPVNGVANIQREVISMFYDAALNLSSGELTANGVTAALPESAIQAVYAAAAKIKTRATELLPTINE